MTGPAWLANSQLKVLVVEHDPAGLDLATRGVRRALSRTDRQLEQLYSARSMHEARGLFGTIDRLDLVLLDLALPDGWGHELIPPLLARWPQVAVIVHTAFDDDANLFRALGLGAGGYILKGTDEMEFARLLADVDEGRPPLSPAIARRLLRTFRDAEPQPGPPLTPKEFEVVQFLARGLTNAEVASCLGISAHTVSSHVKSIYRKLQVSTRAEMTGLAQRNGWVGEMTI